jgi:hypothetical protein
LKLFDQSPAIGRRQAQALESLDTRRQAVGRDADSGKKPLGGGRSGAGPHAGRNFPELALHTSPGCRAFLDDIGPSPRPIEKLQLVRDDLLAGASFGELGRPGEIGGPLGKYRFCHDVFVRRNRE